MWENVEYQIRLSTNRKFSIEKSRPIGGGCINDASCVTGNGQSYFVKTNSQSDPEIFRAEFKALEEISKSDCIRVPKPVCYGSGGGYSFLVMEYLELTPAKGSRSWVDLGVNLARLHKVSSRRFGWVMDNVIGSTPQPNKECEDWISFFRDQRLGHQLKLAQEKGVQFDGADTLLDGLERFFQDYAPRPSLLHGDLWNGNVGFLKSGEPVIFDPATYFGDREAEFGIIEMFGGFAPEFYQGYHSEWPLDQGFSSRKDLYLLYHQLNHFNLFGHGYLAGCRATLKKCLKSVS